MGEVCEKLPTWLLSHVSPRDTLSVRFQIFDTPWARVKIFLTLDRIPRRWIFFFFFITLEPRVSDTQVYEP